MRVLKFGGTSLSSPEKILHVAQNLAHLHAQNEKLVVVVSAMGETTNQLLELAKSVSKNPSPRELDMLLTTGERVSMALLCMALKDKNCESISFTGSQAGVLTDASHFGAKILDVKPVRVIQALKENRIVVVAGFQGVDPQSKEITTLGRGGSDTSAVALAIALKATSCDLLKDVDSLCSADPKLVQKARCYPVMSLNALYEMCFWGAKVLHHRSVELALRNQMHLGVGSSATFKIGTRIVPSEENMGFEQQEILAINSHPWVDHAFVDAPTLTDGIKSFEQILLREKLTPPQILATAQESRLTRIMYAGDQNHLASIREICRDHKGWTFPKELHSSVTLTCFGLVASNLTARALHALQMDGVACEKLIATPLSLTFFVLPAARERAISCLHQFVKGP